MEETMGGVVQLMGVEGEGDGSMGLCEYKHHPLFAKRLHVAEEVVW